MENVMLGFFPVFFLTAVVYAIEVIGWVTGNNGCVVSVYRARRCISALLMVGIAANLAVAFLPIKLENAQFLAGCFMGLAAGLLFPPHK